MKRMGQVRTSRAAGLRRRMAGLVGAAVAAVWFSGGLARAQDATWAMNPAVVGGVADFNTAANWTPATVPGSVTNTGTATFGVSSGTNIGFSSVTTELGGFTFTAGASNYTFTVRDGALLEFTGAGIVVNGGSATINNAGEIQFLNNSTAGNATITNASEVVFLNNSTAGNARLINSGAGATIDFSLSTGPNNDGKLSAGSIEGAGAFFLGSNQLTVGGNNLSTTVSGVISDCGADGNQCLKFGVTGGSLVKVGSGTLTLTGNNTYTGNTTVNGGTLEVDGSISGSLLGGTGTSVNSGGTVSGTGMIGGAGLVVNAGGTLAPGNAANPTGTLTVENLAFESGALYLVQVSGTNASKTSVSLGTVLGGGTVQVAVTGGASLTQHYDILQGGLLPIVGAFAGVNAPNFAASLSQTSNDVFLTLNAAELGAGASLNRNQQSVANGINNAVNASGALPAALSSLFGLTGSNLANALTQVSGETATGSQQTTFDAMGQFMGVMTDPFMDRGGGNGSSSPLGYAAASNPADAFAMFAKAPPQSFEPRWSVWASGFGGSQSTSGNASVGSNNTTSSIAGTAVGADYLISANTIAGFALAGGGTNFSVANGGTGRSDLFQAGAYVRHTEGSAYISAALAYGWQDITTTRTVTAAGFDQLRAEFNANAWSGRLEGGYRFVAPATFGVGITPYAAAQFVTFDLPAYAEQAIVGSNNFALSYNAKDATDARSELGFRTDKSFAMADGILTLRGRFAWAHDYDPDRSIAATFQSLPGASFVVNGAAQAADSALTTASIEMKWKNNWSVAATFEGEFSNVTSSYAGKGVVRYAW
jgi:autotransporter-associated beta strand protein